MRSLLPIAATFLGLIGCGSSEDPAGGPGGPSGTGGSSGTTSGSGAGTGTGTPSGSTGSGNPSCPAGEGYALNQISEDWSLPDHLGGMVNLHQFCGKPVYLEISSMW
ncbi:MAG TPA: hypothetical protein ENK57_08645 [Polyangiaceae bacterium]|nr:hypothetical protein [Polyangiaceae bacterium]